MTVSTDASTSKFTFPEKVEKVLLVAYDLLLKKPDWVTFFREVLGIYGSARSIFTNEEFIRFSETEEFNQIRAMIEELRRKNP